MAHVHGEKIIEAAKKVAEEAPCPFHSAGEMMAQGAGMDMGKMMGSAMDGMKGMGAMTAGVATGTAMTVASASQHSLLRRIVTHPLVLFGAGLAIGYLIHKYREEIIAKAGQTTD